MSGLRRPIPIASNSTSSVDAAQSNDIAEKHSGLVRFMKEEMIALWREMRDEGLSK